MSSGRPARSPIRRQCDRRRNLAMRRDPSCDRAPDETAHTRRLLGRPRPDGDDLDQQRAFHGPNNVTPARAASRSKSGTPSVEISRGTAERDGRFDGAPGRPVANPIALNGTVDAEHQATLPPAPTSGAPATPSIRHAGTQIHPRQQHPRSGRREAESAHGDQSRPRCQWTHQQPLHPATLAATNAEPRRSHLRHAGLRRRNKRLRRPTSSPDGEATRQQQRQVRSDTRRLQWNMDGRWEPDTGADAGDQGERGDRDW